MNRQQGLFNDFYDYWGAGWLIRHGGNPYDLGALQAVERAAGVHSLLGSGYSYPLVFAYLTAPLSLLSARLAAAAFAFVSLVALAAGVMIILGARRLRFRETALAALVVMLFPPVTGSLYFGQANLIVLPLLALAYRGRAPAITLALAAAVKLYPVSGFLAFAGAGVRRAYAGLAGLGLWLALSLAPGALSGRTGGFAFRLSDMLGVDPFWSNQSLNGWLSRLSQPTPWTRPPLPGLPIVASEMVLAAAATLAVAAVVLRHGGGDWGGSFALCLGLGSLLAPKNSLWNLTPLLLAMAFVWSHLRPGRARLPAGLLLFGLVLIKLQDVADIYRDAIYRPTPGLTWLSSMGLYGGVFVCAAAAHLLLAEPRQRAVQAPQALPLSQQRT